ncbi:Uncharacterised protein [Candidatus Bilamarchaeum dharawalense]|uniref:DNA repair protein n=1 Tax=Candidatus Bilamarchaeum dharawalense TaxID=2885759 RepID=A0A5E4LTJ5_9ARCH|nr:Uncharacterised protein [Candidatus Bilamarchaeum dharawalense]
MSKGSYLKRITSNMHMRSIEVGEKLDGSSPPSVFVGSFGYPKVYVGPMISPDQGDTAILDTPEVWIPKKKTQEDIINFRLGLVRGKQVVGIQELNNKLVQKLQEITLATGSVQSEAQFHGKPRGFTFDAEHAPFGPSASIDKFEIDNVKWHPDLEKVYYDTDFKAADAAVELYNEGILFSQIQKALSTGTMGVGKNRKLVPTRWSITATDTILANHLYDDIKWNEIIDCYEVYEFSSLNNYYAIILTPTPWQYEWLEAFIHIMDNEELIYSDYEGTRGKDGYSVVGGCYYSCKFGVLEALKRMRKQSGAIVLREAYRGYVSLGVFNVRENVRNAMKQLPRKFADFRSAMNYVSTKLRLPISRFVDQSALIKDMLNYKQTTL